MLSENLQLIYFFILCGVAIVLLGSFSGFKKIPNRLVGCQVLIGSLLLVHPVSITFFDRQELFTGGSKYLQNFGDSLIFFDIVALMLFSNLLERANGAGVWKRLSLIFVSMLMFFYLAFDSVSGKDSLRDLTVLLSFSFMVILGSIFYQCTAYQNSGIVSYKFVRSLKIVLVASAGLWSIYLIHQLWENSSLTFYNDLYLLWLVLKIILIHNMFQFSYVIDEIRRERSKQNLFKKLRSILLNLSIIKNVLYNFPAFLLLTDRDGNILFVNRTALSKLGSSSLKKKHFNSLFMGSLEEAVTTEKLTYKDANNSLHMFLSRTEKILDNKNQKEYWLWILKSLDFDFEVFCKSIIDNKESFKITGLLDHNFAIYRMSITWKKLIEPVDKFFHSGIIWDKLKLLSENYLEIAHIENKIGNSKKATGWLRVRSGDALVITLEKIYAPDRRLFYHVNARYVIQ